LEGAAITHPLEIDVTSVEHSTVEPKTVTVSEKLKHLELEYTYLKYGRKDIYWKFVNAVVLSAVLDGYFHSKIMFSDIGLNERQGASWSTATATEFYRQDELVSIRIYHHWYGSGAAHPNHGISTLNFLGRDFGNITIEALLAYDKRFSRELMKRCFDELVVRNASEDGEPESPLFPLDELQNEAWANLAQFNFDRQGITFNFAPLPSARICVRPTRGHRALEISKNRRHVPTSSSRSSKSIILRSRAGISRYIESASAFGTRGAGCKGSISVDGDSRSFRFLRGGDCID